VRSEYRLPTVPVTKNELLWHVPAEPQEGGPEPVKLPPPAPNKNR
jgi:hypothetical protein